MPKKDLPHSHHHSTSCNRKTFVEIANESLKAASFKITKPRLAVINCLADSNLPLSPKKVFEKIKNSGDDDIDQVSVYRALDSLREVGVIHQVFPSGDYVSCQTGCEKEPSHILTQCVSCGVISEVALGTDFIHDLFQKILTQTQFKPQSHVMQINGICAECG